jgi:hypothetical protein
MSDGGKGSSPRPYSVSNEEYANRWDAIFAREKQEKALDELRWVYIGHSPHNNEHKYKCTICDQTDWIASYGTMSQLKCKCK